MTPPVVESVRVSVVVVSRGRADALCRCVQGLSQMIHRCFEVVVVADPAGLAALDRAGWTGRIGVVACDEANISVARNLGIAAAGGDIVAFIDDDAVPEPTWLDRLTDPFADPDVAATGGYVRGRNGISFQWRGRLALGDGTTIPVQDTGKPIRIRGVPGRGAKTEGTNMAVRRNVLMAMGGFDPVFRFYLDETDLNLRLAATGAATVLVPMAEVHHGFAASDRRRSDRVPRDLTQIGASLAAFLRRHGPADTDALRSRHRAAQRARLLRHMTAGRIEPRDVGFLLAGFDAGWTEGAARPTGPLSVADNAQPFLRMVTTTPQGHRLLGGRVWQGARLRAEAARLVRDGWRVSLHLFSPTVLRHRVSFTHDGVWEQTGGLFGASDRSDPAVQLTSHAGRLARERARVAVQRADQQGSGNITSPVLQIGPITMAISQKKQTGER